MTPPLDRPAADDLIAEANRLHSEGDRLAAAPIYLEVAQGYPPYASFALVAGDSYWAAGQLAAAAAAYRLVIAAVPQHEDAWHNLGMVLMLLGEINEGREALVRAQALGAGFADGEVDEAIDRYWMSHDPGERATIVNRIAESDDPRVNQVLHDHLARAQRYGTAVPTLDHWASVATALVRFGMADFLDWYSDGPAPSQKWVLDDVERYLANHPMPEIKVWPIHFTQQPYHRLPGSQRSLWQRIRSGLRPSR